MGQWTTPGQKVPDVCKVMRMSLEDKELEIVQGGVGDLLEKTTSFVP